MPYVEWRTKVFVRDDYTCQTCGKRGGELNADHYPVMFFEILENNNINSVKQALACKELWDTGNAQTLCQPCHKSKTVGDLKYMHKNLTPEKRILQQKGLNRSGGTSGRKWKVKAV